MIKKNCLLYTHICLFFSNFIDFYIHFCKLKFKLCILAKFIFFYFFEVFGVGEGWELWIIS